MKVAIAILLLAITTGVVARSKPVVSVYPPFTQCEEPWGLHAIGGAFLNLSFVSNPSLLSSCQYLSFISGLTIICSQSSFSDILSP